MAVLRRDHTVTLGVEHHQIGVAAGFDRSLLRVHAVEARGILAEISAHLRQADAVLLHAVGVHQDRTCLHAGHTVRYLCKVLLTRALLIDRKGTVIGADGVQSAGFQTVPQCLTVVVLSQRRRTDIFRALVKRTAVNAVSSTVSSVFNTIKGTVESVWNGIKSASSWLMDRIGEWCDNIVGGIKRFFRISSPSKVMADEVGIYMAEGIGLGFEKEIPEVEKDMKNALSDLSANVKTSMNPNVNTKVGNYQFIHQITINTNGNLTEEQVDELSKRIVNDVSIDLGRRVFA